MAALAQKKLSWLNFCWRLGMRWDFFFEDRKRKAGVDYIALIVF